MASLYNKGQRRARVKVRLMTYDRNIQVTDQIIDINVQYARDYVWRQMCVSNEADFRTYVTIADGDQLPADFTSFSYDASYIAAGQTTRSVFKYIDIQELASVKTNPFEAATAVHPVIYFTNQKIKTYPASLTGITFGYYPRQAEMFGDTIADATTDTMPQNAEDVITELAYERTLQQLLSEEKAYALAQQQAAEVLQETQKYFEGMFEVQMMNARLQR